MQLSLRRTAAPAALATAALAAPTSAQPTWHHCGNAPHTQCARFTVPLDYDAPLGRKIELFVARAPATDRRHRLGTLFVNFGGPGGTSADIIEGLTAEQLPKPNERWDLVAMDPRGVGQSRPAIECGTRTGRSMTPSPAPEGSRTRSTASSRRARPTRRPAASAAPTRGTRSTPWSRSSTAGRRPPVTHGRPTAATCSPPRSRRSP